MKYNNEEKEQLVRKYFELKTSEVPVSVRTYAAHIGVRYYTFRDWYRDYKANAEYQNITTEEYSEKRIDEAKDALFFSADDGFSFVKITRGGIQ